ncbi:hypothetical protein [Streptomyces aureus]|uniref:PH domain-containing protein n=1 Tax=Streptomyces aureus TaxID=193461 RepID=A0ABV4SVE1_9ACTN
MPSVIGLLEQREARAQGELESWLEVLRQAQEEVATAQKRAERARVAREELVQALAEEGVESGPVPPLEAGAAAEPGGGRADVGFDERPPQWRPGMDEAALSGMYREVFRIVAAAEGAVAGAELARGLGRGDQKNEVEKARHRAYTLEARGWLVRESGGLFRCAPGTSGLVAQVAFPASAERPRPGGG